MKKTVSLLIAVLMMVFAMTACGQSKFVGKWEATEIESAGAKITVGTVGVTMTIDVNADNTCTMTINGETSPSIKWSESGDTMTLTSDESSSTQTISCKLDGDVLVIDGSSAGLGNGKIYFEKK